MNKHLILSFALAAFSAFAADTPRRAVAVISIDGMHPDCVLKADEHGLRIPNLRRFLRDGTHASAVTWRAADGDLPEPHDDAYRRLARPARYLQQRNF